MKTIKGTFEINTPYGEIDCKVEYSWDLDYLVLYEINPIFNNDEPEFIADITGWINDHHVDCRHQIIEQILNDN